jgi:Na+-driven multidrug efflux pump
VGIFVITYFISEFGKEAVAAYGIATRIEQIVLLPTIGLNTAALTLVAQNNGAKRFDRIRQTLHVSLRYGGVLMGAGAFALFFCAPYLMGLFTKDSAVARIGSSYLRIAAFVLSAYVILYVNVATLQGLKRPLFAVWIGLFRQIVAPTLVFFLCTQVFHLGLMGIWWGIFSITWGAALFTLFYVRRLLEQDVFR